jgi:hypothetical protein
MSTSPARDLLDKALKRRDELRAELEALESFVDSYTRVVGLTPEQAAAQERHPDLYSGTSPRAIQRARVADLLMAARRMIIAEGRPMKRGELAKRLLALGHEIAGADKSKVLGTNLWRSGKFKVIKGQGYWPNDVAVPEGARSR